MSRVYTLTSRKTSKVYEVTRTRSQSSYDQVTWHYRRAGDNGWQSLAADTLAQVKVILNAS